MSLRPLFCLAVIAASAVAPSNWTVTLVHPSAVPSSYIQGAAGNQQVGYTSGNGGYAALWTGSQGSYVNLNPAGASYSSLTGTNGEKQVGYATLSGKNTAGLWTGTAASFIPLTASNIAPSYASAISGNQQVGSITMGGKIHAALWTGTAASMVDIHPAAALESVCQATGGGKQGGRAWFDTGYPKAVLWSGTAASAVIIHPTGFRSSSIEAMSAVDQVGTVLTEQGQIRATLWRGTAASSVDLHPAGAAYSSAYATNGEYQGGSYALQGSSSHAAIWKGTAASMEDLHQYVPQGYVNSTIYAVWSHNGVLYAAGDTTNGATFKQEACIWSKVDPNAFEFTMNKTQVAGQNSVQGTITAAASVPTARVYTTYDNSSLVNTPATVTLAANTTVKNFQITTTAVNSTINTTVYARFGSVTQSRPLALIPLIPTALAFTPTQVVGGNSVSCRVVINGVAGPSGRTIAILDNSPNATCPSMVTVPPGATQVIFSIATTAVTAQKTVTVTARVSAGEKTGTFKINP